MQARFVVEFGFLVQESGFQGPQDPKSSYKGCSCGYPRDRPPLTCLQLLLLSAVTGLLTRRMPQQSSNCTDSSATNRLASNCSLTGQLHFIAASWNDAHVSERFSCSYDLLPQVRIYQLLKEEWNTILDTRLKQLQQHGTGEHRRGHRLTRLVLWRGGSVTYGTAQTQGSGGPILYI